MDKEAQLTAVVPAVSAHAGAADWAACGVLLSPDLMIHETDGLPYPVPVVVMENRPSYFDPAVVGTLDHQPGR